MASFAKSIGKVLAYVQDTIDVAMGWAFHRLKSVPNPEKKKTHFLTKAASAIIRFFGTLGDSFYREYNQLKKKKRN